MQGLAACAVYLLCTWRGNSAAADRQAGPAMWGNSAAGSRTARRAAGAAILCREPRYMGRGGSGKTAGPFWAWGRIHYPHPLPHSTAFKLTLPYLIPPRKNFPRLSSLSAYGVQRAAEGVPEKRAVGSLETAKRNNNRKFTGLWRDLPWPGFCAHGVGYKFM